MRNRTILALMLGIMSPWSGHAQAIAKHSADFTLTLSAPQETVQATRRPAYVEVTVRERNISGHMINIGRPLNPDAWYKMSVFRDGNPAPLTEFYRQRIAPRKNEPTVSETMDSLLGTLKPDHTQDFRVTLSRYFDMTSPGKYEITFVRGTNPGQPDNVDVTSNTIIITVLPADDAAPAN
jgi:hypothetical protein